MLNNSGTLQKFEMANLTCLRTIKVDLEDGNEESEIEANIYIIYKSRRNRAPSQ